jgi:general secretion pathway protein G
LIFVIVIIGILAAVAIPKLAATRGDADGAKIANNLATCVGDASGAYMKDGAFDTASTACTDGIKDSAATACFTVAGVNATGILTVTDAGATQACTEAHALALKNKMSAAAGQAHQF